MEQMSGVCMEALGREGLLAKLNPEEGTCVSKFLLLSEFFCQVSVFSPKTLALFTLTMPGYLEHLRPSLQVLGVAPPRTLSQPQVHLCLLSKKWQLFPIWGIGGTASLVIMPHHHTQMAPGRGRISSFTSLLSLHFTEEKLHWAVIQGPHS